MKKVVLISLFVLIFIVALSINVFAATTGKVALNLQDREYKKDDEIIVEVSLAEINSDVGIISLGATLDYNSNDLEYVGIKSINEEWSKPSYYDSTKKLIMDRSDLTKSPELLFSVTFKVKATTAKDTTVSLKNIEVSGGEGAFTFADVSKTIKIAETNTGDQNSQTPNQNPSTTTIINQGTNSNLSSGSNANIVNINSNPNGDANANLSNGNLPYTGSIAPILLITMGTTIIIGVVLFIKIRNNKLV